jgi:hypothetical protein
METIKSILEVAKEKGFVGEIDVEPKTEIHINYLRMPLKSSGILNLKYHIMQQDPNGPIICNVWLHFISNTILYDRPLASLYNGHVNRNLGPKVFTDLIRNIDMIKDHLDCGSDDEDIAIEKWINNSTFEVLEG